MTNETDQTQQNKDTNNNNTDNKQQKETTTPTAVGINLAELYVFRCGAHSIKPNSHLLLELNTFSGHPETLTELDLSQRSYVGPNGFLPVIESVIKFAPNLRYINASDNRLTNEVLDVFMTTLEEKIVQNANVNGGEFSIDLTRNPITYIGGKRILQFLETVHNNNTNNKEKTLSEDKKISSSSIVVDVNIEGTLATSNMISQVHEMCSQRRLEVKFGEKLADPKKRN